MRSVMLELDQWRVYAPAFTNLRDRRDTCIVLCGSKRQCHFPRLGAELLWALGGWSCVMIPRQIQINHIVTTWVTRWCWKWKNHWFELGHFLEIVESADAQSSGNLQQLHLLRLVGKQPSPILSLWVPLWALFDAWWKWNQLENVFRGAIFHFHGCLQEGMRLYQDNLTMKMPSTKIQIQEFEAPLAKKNVSVGELLNDTLLRRPMVSSHSLSSYTCCGFLASSYVGQRVFAVYSIPQPWIILRRWRERYIYICIYIYDYIWLYMYILHIHKFTKSRKPRTYGGNIIYNILPLSAALVVHSSGLRGAATTVPLGTSWQQKKRMSWEPVLGERWSSWLPFTLIFCQHYYYITTLHASTSY
jgi:hypothetical protein